MAETNTAVAEQVVTAPETIAPAQTSESVVATPEPDLLTKINQFKLPETQDKIENPPEQPELANIKDPEAKKQAQEAVERIRRGLQSQKDKEVQAAQELINKSKNWTPQRIQQELLTNPEFVAAAQMINGQVTPTKPIDDVNAYSVLSEPEKAKVDLIPGLKAELEQMKQKAANDEIRTAISQKDLTLRTTYADYDSKAVDEACVRLGQMNLADVREFVFKAINYEKNSMKSYEYGKLEGQGKLNSKLNIIAPQGSTVTTNPDKPTKQQGESDKQFFVRLGQYNLAQFKNQK